MRTGTSQPNFLGLAGLALLICGIVAAIDVGRSDCAFASREIWAQYVAATTILLAIASLPACFIVAQIVRGTRSLKGSQALAVCVAAVAVPLVLHANRWLHAHLPGGIGPLSAVGLAVTIGLAALACGLGAAVFMLLARSRAIELLARGRALFAVCGWVGFGVSIILTLPFSGGPTSQTGPNIVLMSVDSVRADVFWEHLDASASPDLRSFAAKGRRFRRAYTTYSHSLASHVSMLTGLYPPEHGAVSRTTQAGVLGSAVATDAPHIADRFSELGYETFGVMSNDWLGPPFGAEKGFQTFVRHGRALTLGHFDWTLAEAVSTPGFYKQWIANVLARRGHWNARSFSDWLSSRDRARPFFAFLHFIEMHVPNDPAERFMPEAGGEGFPGLLGSELEERLVSGDIPDLQLPAALRRLRALNLAKLREVEGHFASVLAALESGRWLDNTLVFLTSDHGDHLFEKTGTYGHSHVYETVGRIPLIVSGPGVESADDYQLVSLVDLAPTMYGFTGIAKPDGLSGIDLLADSPRNGDDWIYLQGVDTHVESDWARAVVWADGTKFIRDAQSERVFDLVEDPLELNDLSPSDPKLGASLRKQFDRILVDMRQARDSPVPLDALSGGIKDRLKALGYLD